MSPKNKNTRGLQRIQKPVAGALLLSLAMGQPVLAQLPAPGAPTEASVPATPATAPAPAPAQAPAAPAGTPVAERAPAAPPTSLLPAAPSPFRPRPPAALPTTITGAGAPPASGEAAAANGNALSKGPSTLTTDLPPETKNKMVALKYKDTPLDLILDNVSEWTGRMLLKAPGINATITLMSKDSIPIPEALEAIETVLAMNNVAFVKLGDKFLKVLPIANAFSEDMKIHFQQTEKSFPEADQLVSQVIQLKYMDPTEAQPIIQPLMHGYGKVQTFERTNSLLITDTGANINRIMDVLAYIDQPIESKVETRVYPISYAKASDIASRLNELIADTQGKEEKPRIDNTAIPAPSIPTPPGIIRPPTMGGSSASRASVSASGESAQEAAERGVIRGKVKIVPEERMNLLFIISRTENFVFFDKIITVLDRPTDPEITLRVVPLQFAKSDEIASLLNEFIGAAKEETTKSGVPVTATPGAGGLAANDARSVALRDYINSRSAAAAQPAAAAARARLGPVSDADKDVVGRLSPSTRILAYKPGNSLLLMGRRGDLDALVALIDKLDVMLAQVLIEAVIIEVNLGSDLSYGVDWLQRSMTAYNTTKAGNNGGLSVSQPVFSFGGGTAFGGSGNFQDGANVGRSTALGSGLTYYSTIYGLNLDAVIKMTSGSRDARVLSTPVIMTTDNKEADIKVGEQRPIVNANIVQTTGQNTQNYEYKDIGIELKVTPRINPKGVVEMEIKQTADNVGGNVTINGAEVPIITSRSMSADISVRHNQTVILGGLTSTDKSKSRAGIPILSSIPILGALFRTDSFSDARTEVLVLLTPYVLKSPEEAREETARIHQNSASSKTRWHEGWSDSELPRLTSKEMQSLIERRKAHLLKLDEEESLGGSRVSTSTMTEDIHARTSREPKANAAPADTMPAVEGVITNTPVAPRTAPELKLAPAVEAAPVATPVAPAAAPAATPAPVDPNTPVPLGK